MSRFILLNFFFQAIVASVFPYNQIIFRNKGYSHSFIGIIVASGQIASIILPLLLAAVADKTRKTRSIAIALTVSSVLLYVPAALSGSKALTLIAFMLSFGLLQSLVPVTDGYQNRLLGGSAKSYGIARSAGTMGYVVALLVFGLTGFPVETNNRSISTCYAIIASFFILTLLIAPKDLPAEEVQNAEKGKGILGRGVFSRRFYLMMLVIAVSRIANSVSDNLLSAYLVEDMGLGGNFALFISLGAFSEFGAMNLFGHLLQKRKVRPYYVIVLSILALAARLAIYRLFPSITGLVFAQLLQSMTFGAFHIGATYFIAQNVSKNHYSLAMAFYWTIAYTLPQMFGTLLGGFVIDKFGYPNLFMSYILFPIVAIIMAFCLRKELDVKASA